MILRPHELAVVRELVANYFDVERLPPHMQATAIDIFERAGNERPSDSVEARISAELQDEPLDYHELTASCL